MESKTGIWQAITLVSLMIAVVALIMPFVIPAQQGAEGPQGVPGEDGADGQDGVNGNTGPQGDIGPQGLQGLQGPAGTQGADGTDGNDGIACWDLNGNGVEDFPMEDINGDLAVNVADCTGLTGSTGPQGPIGPPGNGTVMAWSVGSVTGLSNICQLLVGFNVTIKAQTDGYIVVTSMVHVELNHGSGNTDRMEFKISPVQLDCTLDEWSGLKIVDWQLPQHTYESTHTIHRVEPVTAGTHTFYVSAKVDSFSPGPFAVFGGYMIAVFYPS
jgi:hypothetical protein